MAATTSGTAKVTLPAADQFLIEREFAAPAALVWRAVTEPDLVRELGLGQPQVSKHLRVLRDVDLVDVRDHGRQRLYRLNGHALKPIHDWVKGYERLWSQRFELLDDVLEDLKKEQGDGSGD